MRLHLTLVASLSALAFVLIYFGKRLSGGSKASIRTLWAVSFLPLVAVPTILVLRGTSFQLWHLRMAHIAPTVTLLLSAYLFLQSRFHRTWGGLPRNGFLFLGLLFPFGCQDLLQAFPRIDETHIQLNSTVLFILIAFLLWKLSDSWHVLFGKNGHACGYISAAACVVVLAIPQMWSMKILHVFTPTIPLADAERVPEGVKYELKAGTLDHYPLLPNEFPVAEDLELRLWLDNPLHDFVLADTFDSMEYIRQRSHPDDKIFVGCESQIAYLLTERESFLQKEDYFVFLATSGLINRPVRLSDDLLLTKLTREKPRFILMVSLKLSDHTSRVIRIWPKTYEFIRNNYEIIQIYGMYMIFQPKRTSALQVSANNPKTEIHL